MIVDIHRRRIQANPRFNDQRSENDIRRFLFSIVCVFICVFVYLFVYFFMCAIATAHINQARIITFVVRGRCVDI